MSSAYKTGYEDGINERVSQTVTPQFATWCRSPEDYSKGYQDGQTDAHEINAKFEVAS